MRQRQPTKPTRWEPRWARLLDDLRAVGDETDRPDDDSRSLGGSGGFALPSPADARRAAQHGKALAGVTVAIVAAVAAAVVLWHGAATVMRAILKPEAPRVTQTQGTPVVRTPLAAAAAAPPSAAAAAAPTVASPTTASITAPTVAPTAVPTFAPTMAPTTPPTTVPTAAPSRQPSPAAAAATSAPTTVPTRVHVVERGDTLFSIARRNGTTVTDLVAINGLAAPDAILPVGRQLFIPGA